MNQKLKNKLSILLLIIVTIAVLYFALKDDFIDIVNEILRVNIGWLLIAIFLLVSYWYMKSMVLYHTARHFKKDYRITQAFRNILLTQFFNGITPFASGGQPFQVYSLKQEGISLTDGTNIIIQDFIVYQIALVILGIFAIISNHFLTIFPEVGLLKQLVTLGFLINALVIAILFIVAFAKKINLFIAKKLIYFLGKLKIIKDSEKTSQKWKEYISRFHVGAAILMKDKKHFIYLIFLNLVALMSLYLIPMVILFGLGDYTSVTGGYALITSAYVMLIGSFVPIPGGTGGLEYSFLTFYGNFITGSTLKAIMLIWRFITYYFGIIVGAIAINIKEKR
ncbi:MAG: flippase-like domain-containing protein [Bacilli bacterium]|nr:flippase-like domain-containing protein [Bacilli bacterium]